MGIPPSGNTIEVSGMSMDRFSAGKIAEDWTNWYALEMMQQLGAVPKSGPTQGI
jgi:predicted ester cyclase